MSESFDRNTPMPFGKWKGIPIKLIPALYLLWLCKDLARLPQGLREYLEPREPGLRRIIGEGGPMHCGQGHSKPTGAWPYLVGPERKLKLLCERCAVQMQKERKVEMV